MMRRTLARLVPIGLLCFLTACSGSPGVPSGPSSTTAVTEPSITSDTTAMTPSDTADVPVSPDTSGSPDAAENPSPEPGSSVDSASGGEIPSVIHGKWIFFVEGEKPKECSEELEADGTMITIDATTISSFAFVFELESVEASDADSVEGLFTYQDDSDQPMTPLIRLETKDGWQTLEFIELETEGQDPAMYSRCS